ncbi:MAG TPA: MFS transporter [Anaerolineales bacterium]
MTTDRSTDILARNLRHLYADVAWFGVLGGSAMAFISVYAARLGGSPLQIGLLTAGPAGLNLVLSLQAGRWLAGRSFPAVTFWSSVWHRATYLILLLLPGLLPAMPQIWSMLALMLVAAAPATLLVIAFNAAYAELVPPELRAQVTGRRNALQAVTLTLSSLVSGQILRVAPFPLSYQVVFALGALGAAMSSYHLYRLRSPARSASAPGQAEDPTHPLMRPGSFRMPDAFRLAFGLRYFTRAEGRALLRPDLLRGQFGPILLTFLIFYSVQHLPIPLFPVFWVNDLGLSDAAISLGNAFFYAAMLLASLAVGPLRDRLGHRRLILLAASIYGIYPLLNGLATGEALFWLAALGGGAVWGLLSVLLIDHLFDRIPADDRPAHMALHNMALNLGVLAGSLLGPVVAGWVGLREALLLAAGLRLACAGLFLLGKD